MSDIEKLQAQLAKAKALEAAAQAVQQDAVLFGMLGGMLEQAAVLTSIGAGTRLVDKLENKIKDAERNARTFGLPL